MNGRRRMLFGGKIKPLYIFEYGNSALSNGEAAVETQVQFTNGIMKLYHAGMNYGIGGMTGGMYSAIAVAADFTKYKTLHFEARRTKSASASYLVGYGSDAKIWSDEWGDDFTASKQPSYSKTEYFDISFDISKVTGIQYIKAAHKVTEQSIEIKNIWLE